MSSLIVAQNQDNSLAYTNAVYVNPKEPLAQASYVQVKHGPYTIRTREDIAPGTIVLNKLQRTDLQCSLEDKVTVSPWTPPPLCDRLYGVHLEFDLLKKAKLTLKEEALAAHIKERFSGQPLFMGQQFATSFIAASLQLTVKKCSIVMEDKKSQKKAELTKFVDAGILVPTTVLIIEPVKNIAGVVTYERSQNNSHSPLLNPDWKFADMGIGGLDSEFSTIFRRAFASRLFPPAIIKELGIKHVKGMLLYGPPGTGKTLIARQISKMLAAGAEPKVVNGPEILDKYVGQSEQNIRNLFTEAEKDYKSKGEASRLHVIIFDEIDAICKKRGTVGGGTGVHDTVVNQLLSKIDGVDALNNILVIGMTNRKDMIDAALLRPGRLEVHVEIGLPDQEGRRQIFEIHTKEMRSHSRLSDDVDLDKLAELTKNFSGAEIEGLVKSASSFALYGSIDVTKDAGAAPKKELSNIVVRMSDFIHALEEVEPSFGVAEDDLKNVIRMPLIDYGPEFRQIMSAGHTLIKQVQQSDRTPLMSVLLQGPAHVGKTAIAAQLALDSKYPFIKLLSPELMVGQGELVKAAEIAKVFDDAYRSPLSIIIIDNIERLVEYVAIGPRFSNHILQTLLVVLKRVPPLSRKLLVIATTSTPSIIRDLGLADSFNVVLDVPSITRKDQMQQVFRSLSLEVKDIDAMAKATPFPIGLKQLLMLIEMTRQSGDINPDAWAQSIRDAGLRRRKGGQDLASGDEDDLA
jgi:vesicle-fusing ATPase